MPALERAKLLHDAVTDLSSFDPLAPQELRAVLSAVRGGSVLCGDERLLELVRRIARDLAGDAEELAQVALVLLQ